MKFPVNRQWKVIHDTDIGVDVLATKNISFDKDGVASLSERVVTLFNTDNDADIDTPIAAYFDGSNLTTLVCADEVFDINIDATVPTATQTSPSFGDTPDPDTVNSAAVFFNNEWVMTEDTELCTFSSGATAPWTRRTLSPALTSGKYHPVTVNRANNSLCIGNYNGVAQINTSWATGTLSQLTLPTGYEVTAIAYNRNLIGISTWSDRNDEAHFYIWDAGATSANYAYPIGSNRAYFVAPYKDTFVILTGKGQLLKWASTGMEQLAALPSFYTTATLGDIKDRADTALHCSYFVDGDILLFSIQGDVEQQGTEINRYLRTQPSGVWCYDPTVGLYHRYAPSSPKLLAETIGTGDVNTSTNVITLGSVTCPETGTEVVYTDYGSTTIGGLKSKQTYYVIKVTDATLKLALTRADALAGTAIDLTGTGNGNQALQFFPAWDYGQLYGASTAGAIIPTGAYIDEQCATPFLFGFRILYSATLSVKDSVCVTSRFADNRGWLMTQKMFSPAVTEHWEKLFVKARGLKKAGDEVIVKYRTGEDTDMPVYVTNSYITWTDANTFTSTEDLSNVDVGYEVEFIAGAGSGYLAHVSSISLNAGTYTVNIDEDIRNISANDTGYCVFDNWLKLGTTMTHTSNKDYTEFPIGKASKWIQFRFELRGKGVAIEEYELVNKTQKAAA